MLSVNAVDAIEPEPFIEGIVYGGFPALARRLAAEVLSIPENMLRVAGLVAVAIGVGIVWLVRG